MTDSELVLQRLTTAGFAIAGFLILLVGGGLFAFRQADPASAAAWFLLERSLIVTAVVATALGLVMLEGLLQGVGERVFARLGAAAFLFAAVLVVVSEAATMARGPSGPSEEETLLLHRMYAGTALLAQVSFGVALLRTTLLPKWIGWAVLGWNISWLLALPLINVLAGNPGYYYPGLHHLMPFLVGVALLRRPPPGASPG